MIMAHRCHKEKKVKNDGFCHFWNPRGPPKIFLLGKFYFSICFTITENFLEKSLWEWF